VNLNKKEVNRMKVIRLSPSLVGFGKELEPGEPRINIILETEEEKKNFSKMLHLFENQQLTPEAPEFMEFVNELMKTYNKQYPVSYLTLQP